MADVLRVLSMVAFGLFVAVGAAALRVGVFRQADPPLLTRVQLRLLVAVVALFVTAAVLSIASFAART